MTTREFDGIRLEKLREHVWEIPREGEMNVPARVLASETLLEEIGEDDTLRQLKNATHLPGMVEPALCMPDGHQGYGFPVGGVGAIDARTGCISPGAIGYDINCLSGDSEVLLSHGRRRRIENLFGRFEDERARVAAADGIFDSDIQLFSMTDDRTVYEIETETGDTVTATGDHPFQTSNGMTEVDDLATEDDVFLHPFKGFPDDEPPEFVVLDEDDFADEDPQLVRVLKERDLLPLRSTDDAFHRLLKLVGYHTGDGSFSRSHTCFYGDPADLEAIQHDIEAIGLTPSKIYDRERDHDIDGNEFTRTEYSINSGSNAFKQLLIRLGAPEGRKVESEFTVPDYLHRLTDWQRALYLSAFFGAEMSRPDTVAPKNSYAPSVSHNRVADHRVDGETFMRDLMRHLNELGIRTNALEEVERTETTAGETVRLRFGISTDSDNLIRFFTQIGYRYAHEKQRRGLLVAQYLKRKEQVINERARVAEEARALADGGMATRAIKDRFDQVNDRFIERSLYGGRKGRPRPPADFPDFEQFREQTTVRNNLTISSEVTSITERGKMDVFDIGVTHDAHNFVANGFVVSNCGVRMVRTSLTYDDVRGCEAELVDALFEAIPSGLGGGGVIDGDADAIEGALERGVEWAVSEGYGIESDLTHCEDEGRRPDARPEYVSRKATDRGRNQMGSLGSGNHFLEVQRVTDVFREEVAEAYRLSEGQIVVLIHCGSRGLGHQTCNDYLRRIERDHADLLESLPDKELAAAPAGSELAEEYYGAMGACINFAWVNRQLITHRAREVFGDVFDADPIDDLGMELLYDVAHNIGKKETHEVPVGPDGRPATTEEAVDRADRELYVHRKGATRAFPAGREEVPEAYRSVGQPVIIPGSMGAGSYVLRGGSESMSVSFGSTAHGAGRLMSRTQAKQEFWGGDVRDDLEREQAIYVKAQSGATVAEEAPGVYKDVDEVVRVSDELGIGDTVARTFPVCNIKG
ncbi:RtcB family protein [Halorubrum rubrum]|uniref:tRNA-splicing ligase RtcB n=1 Tax=Halorubrum rubrum TaxID=1126240 RepID=A0ABD5R4G5_9EURY|nr:RtcB family protein [Halorubrum rubrum]